MVVLPGSLPTKDAIADEWRANCWTIKRQQNCYRPRTILAAYLVVGNNPNSYWKKTREINLAQFRGIAPNA
jgi:hypothetical protein